MATASAVSGQSKWWHVKGTWSARDDRTPSAVWLGVLWIGMIAGFGVDFPRYLHESPPAPWIVHVHAVVYSGWMLILTMQVLLVLGDKVGVHRKTGWVAAGWAGLMLVMGPLAAVAFQVVNFGSPIGDPPFLAVQFLNVAGFLSLLSWGIALRKNPAAHRRLMILSTVALADPGFSRFSGWLWPTPPSSGVVVFLWVFYGNVLLVGLILGWDLWEKRLIRSAVIAGISLVGLECVETWLYLYPPWRQTAANWVKAWTRIHI
jgi:hypothetical protein